MQFLIPTRALFVGTALPKNDPLLAERPPRAFTGRHQEMVGGCI
ncbi:MAG: hypothetical protein RMJ33_11635 [Saprospiraceae bacterium]|nr:hypothetical protein [Saprospiraceae bacterium]MDW8230481.1 hypothetical protein [Saprospiraceae bacterium]